MAASSTLRTLTSLAAIVALITVGCDRAEPGNRGETARDEPTPTTQPAQTATRKHTDDAPRAATSAIKPAGVAANLEHRAVVLTIDGPVPLSRPGEAWPPEYVGLEMTHTGDPAAGHTERFPAANDKSEWTWRFREFTGTARNQGRLGLLALDERRALRLDDLGDWSDEWRGPELRVRGVPVFPVVKEASGKPLEAEAHKRLFHGGEYYKLRKYTITPVDETYRVDVQATAYDRQFGAGLGDYIITGLSSWPVDLREETVRATGRPRIVACWESVTPDGFEVALCSGVIFYLDDANWEPVHAGATQPGER